MIAFAYGLLIVLMVALFTVINVEGATFTNEQYKIPATGPVLYDNSLTFMGYYYCPTKGNGEMSTNEFGDEITFAPTGSNRWHTIGSIKCEYFGFHGMDTNGKTIRFRLYQRGSLSHGTPVPPDNLLYDNAPIPIRPGYNTLWMDGLNLQQVPDTVIWTVQFSGIESQDRAGLLLYDHPTIGHSFADFWEREGTRWITKQLTQCGNLPSNFVIQVQAVSQSEKAVVRTLPGDIRNTYLGGFPPTPPAFPDCLMQKSSDTNRFVISQRLTLEINDSHRGMMMIHPYANAYYPRDTEITLTATPISGSVFHSWSGDLSGCDNPIKVRMNSDQAIWANFAPVPGSFTGIHADDARVVIQWQGSGLLQQSSSISGPWLDVPDAVSPFTTNRVEVVRFFRLKAKL